jgi:3-hydroxyisobutyrate dehydrogenase-like beta-hydroxyacid dehydrogenase
MKVGFVGLGAMGLPMAKNLIKAGHSLTVWNRTSAVAQQLEPAGAQVAATPAGACQGEILITMVSDDSVLEELFFGEPQVMASLPPGAIHLSMSTISPAESTRLSKAHAKAGSIYVSAPVFGRPDAAAGAKLLIVAAGPATAIDRCRPIFSALGPKTLTVGENPSAANVFKISGNFLIASVIECLGEAFALLRKSGVDPRLFLETMTGGLFAAPVYKGYGALILEENPESVGFSVRLGLKDVKLVLSAGETASVPMPVANVVRDHLIEAMARGWQDRDWSSLTRVVAADVGL